MVTSVRHWLQEFVAACLQKESGRRPRARELMQHRFVTEARETSAELMERIAERTAAMAAGTTGGRSSSGDGDTPAHVTKAGWCRFDQILCSATLSICRGSELRFLTLLCSERTPVFHHLKALGYSQGFSS